MIETLLDPARYGLAGARIDARVEPLIDPLLPGGAPTRFRITLVHSSPDPIGVPAEVFTIFGFAIKQQSPFRMTAVVGYAHDFVGYVPRPRDFDDSGFGQYAAIKAPKILGLPEFAPQVGDVLVAASTRTLRGIS